MPHKTIFPGITVSVITAMAALFLSEHYSAPAMLFALLLGIAMSFLYEDTPCREGITFSASFVLRVGVALLGLRIALNDLLVLGVQTIVLLVFAISTTIGLGIFISKRMGLSGYFGALTGGSTAICGASAAMAITAVLPDHEHKERDTLLTIIGVTSLSTVAMVVYPILVGQFGFATTDAGILLGGTIHDVAQVVGAGYSVSEEVGDTATLVKLMRVSLLMPVVLIILAVVKRQNTVKDNAKAPGIPIFLVVFIILMCVNSLVNIPEIVSKPLIAFSRFALVTSIAAIGMKSNLSKLTQVGFRPIILMVVETLWIGVFILVAILSKQYLS
jgi:uncharacterized integral membrane protein (TIGR00698 family)